MTPVSNLSNKLKKRPSFVDEESSWNPETEQILSWVIFSLITVSLILAAFVTLVTLNGPGLAHFKTEDVKTHTDRNPEPPQELPEFEGLQRDFLLDKDITIEEVIEMKRVLEDNFVDEEVYTEDVYYNDVPARDERRLHEETADRMTEGKESLQLIEKAEEILERETKLLEEVSKKLDEFVAHSKKMTTGQDEQEVNEDAVAEEMATVVKKSKFKGKRTKNKNPLTRSLGPKMSKLKPQLSSTTPKSIQYRSPQFEKESDVKSDDRESDNSVTSLDDDRDDEREDVIDDGDSVKLGEDRVKRSRYGSNRSKIKMMRFRKQSSDIKDEKKKKDNEYLAE